MASTTIVPYDWSRSITSSDHSSISGYANACTDTTSSTYALLDGNDYIQTAYLLFNGIPKSNLCTIDSVTIRIKARTEYADGSAAFRFEYNGTTYKGSSVALTSTPTVYTLNFPSNATYEMLQGATSVYIVTGLNNEEGSHYLYLYGGELDIEYHINEQPHIFNLILPRG